jgi:hypothetical protein
MEEISAYRLKRGLSKIKKKVNEKFGGVWKMKKNEVINKIRSLNYTYNQPNQELRTNSMIRKPAKIRL